MRRATFLLPGLLVAGGCRSVEADVESEAPAGAPVSSWFAAPGEGALYPSGEGPEDAPPPGAQWESGPFPHDMQPTGTGRMYLLELYQQAIEEKEGLQRELAGLTRTLDATYLELDAANARAAELESEVEELRGETERLASENADLGGRLATAQIRRLEAEKMLLEAKIEWADYLRGERRGPSGARGEPLTRQSGEEGRP